MSSASPTYFAPDSPTYAAITQPENYLGPYASPVGVPSDGGYPVQVGQPIPFSNPDVNSGQYSQPPAAHGCVDPVEQILASHHKLSFHSNQRIGCAGASVIVQIRGELNQLIMSSLMTTITDRHSHSNPDSNTARDRTRSIVTFSDPTGRNMMTCTQTNSDLQEVTVMAGDKFLGLIKGAPVGCTCCGSDVSAEGSNGDSLFDAVKRRSGITFVVNGTAIATARKGVVNEDAFGLEFSTSVAPDTKAMVVTAAYYLYILYYAKTVCGCSGSMTLARCYLLVFVATAAIMITAVVGLYRRFRRFPAEVPHSF